MKIHLFNLFSSFFLLSFGIFIKKSQPNTLICARDGLLLSLASYGVLSTRANVDDLITR